MMRDAPLNLEIRETTCFKVPGGPSRHDERIGQRCARPSHDEPEEVERHAVGWVELPERGE
jgi:hypothetical protein